MKLHSQNGFTVIEVLLVLVILVIVGATGVFVYSTSHGANKYFNAATTASQVIPAKLTKIADDSALIRKAVLAYADNQGPDNAKLKVAITHQNSQFALGTITAPNGDSAGQFFAQKTKATWNVVSQGKSGHCDELVQHGLTSWDATCTKP